MWRILPRSISTPVLDNTKKTFTTYVCFQWDQPRQRWIGFSEDDGRLSRQRRRYPATKPSNCRTNALRTTRSTFDEEGVPPAPLSGSTASSKISGFNLVTKHLENISRHVSRSGLGEARPRGDHGIQAW